MVKVPIKLFHPEDPVEPTTTGLKLVASSRRRARGYWSGRVLRARAIDSKMATRGSSLRK